MAQTIPGGAYQLPDGRWINAAGKQIAAPNEDELYQREEVVSIRTPDQITPGAGLLGTGDEFARPRESISEDDLPKTTRRGKKS